MALKGQLQLGNLSSDPASGMVAGQMYYNTTNNVVRVYDGTNWVNASSGGSGSIPQSGLVFHLDASDSSSYSGSGSTWYDLTSNNYDWNVNASSFVSTGIKHFDFSSGYRAIYTGGGSTLTDVPSYANATMIAFSTVQTSTSNYRTLTRGRLADHQAIIQTSANDLGVYDNNTGGLFMDSGYDITSVTNYSTKFNGLFFRRSTSSPYWAFSVNNDTSNRATVTNSAATYTSGFCVIGGYHVNSTNTYQSSNAQSWGKFHAFLYYNRQISFSEQADIYNYYKTALGI